MFHASWPVGHNSTDYSRYYNASEGEVYKVTQYQASYEPYVVFKKTDPPWYVHHLAAHSENIVDVVRSSGATRDLWAMGGTRRLVSLRCISPAYHTTCSPIISSYIKVIRTKRQRGRTR